MASIAFKFFKLFLHKFGRVAQPWLSVRIARNLIFFWHFDRVFSQILWPNSERTLRTCDIRNGTYCSLVPIHCGSFIDKILAEFENPQQNCTTTSGAFRSTTPVTLCDKPWPYQNLSRSLSLLPCSLTSARMEGHTRALTTQIQMMRILLATKIIFYHVHPPLNLPTSTTFICPIPLAMLPASPAM